jgi:hypothetical protein
MGKKEVEVTKLPQCDLCENKAQYDALMKDGRWAFLCKEHWADRAMFPSLGVGKGQRLVIKKELHPK